MQTVSKRLILPYTRKQMFDLVNAIEDYPLFLPWCQAVQVHSRCLVGAENVVGVENVVKVGNVVGVENVVKVGNVVGVENVIGVAGVAGMAGIDEVVGVDGLISTDEVIRVGAYQVKEQEIKATMHVVKGPVKFEVTTINLARENLVVEDAMLENKVSTNIVPQANIISHALQSRVLEHALQANAVQKYNAISLKLASGPFRYLDGSWKFIDLANGMSVVELQISFQFTNKLFAMALEPLFLGVSNTLVEAFAQRAAKVYNSSS